MGCRRRLRSSARTLVALAVAAAGVAVPACGHDWSAGRDAADAPADFAPDETPPIDVEEDEATTGDARQDVETEDGSGADADQLEDAPSDVPDVSPPCLTPTGHDEDGDGVDDGCDNCPTYVNAGQMDEDGDTLGDACEEPGDPELFSNIIGFDPFTSHATSPGLEWEVWGGTWLGSGDSVSGTSMPLGGNYWCPTLVGQPLAVESEFRLLSAGSEGADVWGCVLLGLIPEVTGSAGGAFSTCCFSHPGRELSIWHWRTGNPSLERLAANTAPVESPEYPPEMRRRIHFLWDGRVLRCRLDTGAELAESSTVLYVPSLSMREELEFGAPGIRVYNGTAEFHSFIAYQ